MADQDHPSDDPRLAEIARHALHDEELVAAFAAGDVDDPADADRARGLVERCATCRSLHEDLSALRAAMRASGTAAERASTAAAPRDFRLSAEDAARLRPGSPVARLAVRLGWRTRLRIGLAGFGRPVGAAMATFGVVGLLVGSLTLGGSPLATMSGASRESAVPGVDQVGTFPESTRVLVSYGPGPSAKDQYLQGGQQGERDGGGPGPNVILLGGSLALVVVGFGLFLAARRFSRAISTPRGN